MGVCLTSRVFYAGFGWETYAYPFVFQRFSEPVDLIAARCAQPVNLWQTAEQSAGPVSFADVCCCEQQSEGMSLAVTDRVQLGVHPAPNASRQHKPLPTIKKSHSVHTAHQPVVCHEIAEKRAEGAPSARPLARKNQTCPLFRFRAVGHVAKLRENQ